MAISLYERCGAVNAINDVGNKVTARRVQIAVLMLLSHSRLLLHPKPAVSRGKMPRVNLASEKERTNCSIRRAM